MKRLFALVLAVVLTVVMSVTAFGATPDYMATLDYFTDIVDGNTIFKPFFLDYSEEVKTFMEKCLTNKNNLLVALKYYNYDPSKCSISFYYVPDGTTFTKEETSGSNTTSLKMVASVPLQSVTFTRKTTAITDDNYWDEPLINTDTSFPRSLLSYAMRDTDLVMTKMFPLGFFTHSSDFVIDSRYIITGWEGELGFVINGNTVLPPTEPPVGPSQPDIGYPDFPKVEGEYIAYDTTIWNSFAFTVRDTIGKVSNVGFVVFGVITGASIIVNLTKKFIGDHDE